LRAVAGEVEVWRAQASVIADAETRSDALDALARKRPHLDGAALFWTLPRRRNLDLLRLLVAYELILEFLDNMNERAAHAGVVNGRQLHRALVEALDPDAPISDYYRHHPWPQDGGYLRTLVETCRRRCQSLTSYARVRRLVIREAQRAQVLAINHEPDSRRRDVALRRWVLHELSAEARTDWFELSGAATAPLTIHMLLALAAEPACDDGEIDEACSVYFPGLSLVATMLDSYVDQAQDVESDNHSYIAHYQTPELARRRIGELIARSVREARGLRNGDRHVVIAACMIAMYLSSDSALDPSRRDASRELTRAGGVCTRLLLPVLRIWRSAYALRSA